MKALFPLALMGPCGGSKTESYIHTHLRTVLQNRSSTIVYGSTSQNLGKLLKGLAGHNFTPKQKRHVIQSCVYFSLSPHFVKEEGVDCLKFH